MSWSFDTAFAYYKDRVEELEIAQKLWLLRLILEAVSETEETK